MPGQHTIRLALDAGRAGGNVACATRAEQGAALRGRPGRQGVARAAVDTFLRAFGPA